MQESYSGTFMMNLMMMFFIIFIAFVGVALNFAKIYRIKNGVINILEQYQYNGNIQTSSAVENNLKTYLLSVPYGYAKGIRSDSFYNNYCASRVFDDGSIDKNLFTNYGVCAIKKKVNNKYFYTVTVYYMIEFPVFNLRFPISASGETIAIDDYEKEVKEEKN